MQKMFDGEPCAAVISSHSLNPSQLHREKPMPPPLFAWLKSLKSLITGTQKRKPRRNERRYRPQLQQLEDRVVPTIVAYNDAYSVHQGQDLSVSAANGVLANDTDSNNLALMTATTASYPSHGYLMPSSDGSFFYEPNSGYVGDDTFTYTASDGTDTSNTATVTIHVTDTAPVVFNHSYTTYAGQNLNVSAANGIISDATDADGDSLTAIVQSWPEWLPHGGRRWQLVLRAQQRLHRRR